MVRTGDFGVKKRGRVLIHGSFTAYGDTPRFRRLYLAPLWANAFIYSSLRVVEATSWTILYARLDIGAGLVDGGALCSWSSFGMSLCVLMRRTP